MKKFKIDDKVVCIAEQWEDAPNIYPVQNGIYTISDIDMDGDHQWLILKEIPSIIDDSQWTWSEIGFERPKNKEKEKQVKYVVVEIDKSIKEKRKEVVFEN